jgi:hypothetical protein
MSDPSLYQIRIDLDDALARAARADAGDPAFKPIAEILARHNAAPICQFDAFANYVAEAEKHGIDEYPLYAWTKATIEDPVKEAKYIKSFTLHVDGDEVYAKDKADALEAALRPLVDAKLVAKIYKHDTNPANSPQMPERYRS